MIFIKVHCLWKLELMIYYSLHVNLTDNFCSGMVGLFLCLLLYGIYF